MLPLSAMEVYLPPILLMVFIAIYAVVAPKFATEKQRAYVMSTFSSGVMTLVSIPYLLDYLRFGIRESFEMAQSGWRKEVGRVGVVFFGTYLFADLAVGYLKYSSQVGFLTGWIHHIVYMILMIYLSLSRDSPVFLTAAIMELPTFDLAVSNLFPSVRSDPRFLSGFFLIRILFHAVYLVDCARPSSRASMDGSWVPTGMLALALGLHVSWFRGGLTGYLKRRKAGLKGGKAKSSLLPTEKDVTASTSTTTELSSVPSMSYLSATPPSGTPEDSPLVTPYTPGVTPLSLRDSYLSLPSLGMPSLPTVSIPSIPSMPSLLDLTAALPKRDMGAAFGFRDAVKSRWEEQRERFSEMGKGIGVPAMGMPIMPAMPLLRRRNRLGSDESDTTRVTVQEVLAGQADQ